jgi:hypothetical protein
VKLYRSTKDTRWFAFGSKIGSVIFPAEVAGWNKRQPTCGADLIDMREVPLCMGFNTGLPGASMSASAASALRLLEVDFTEHKKGNITCRTLRLKGCVGRCSFQPVDDVAHRRFPQRAANKKVGVQKTSR